MMKTQIPTRRDDATASPAFVNEREAAKLSDMLTIAAEDLKSIAGGAAALAKSMACCCCHHGSLA